MSVTMRPQENAPWRFVIEGEMTIYTALQMKDQLLAGLAQCAALEVDLAGVSEIDSAGLQLLVLLKQEATAQHKTLSITGHSPAVLEIFDLCKLEGFFGDPVLIRAKE